MKKILFPCSTIVLFFGLLSVGFITISCKKDDTTTVTPTNTTTTTTNGTWTKIGDYDGGNVIDPTVLTFDKKVYVIAGAKGVYNATSKQNDYSNLKTVWEFDSQTLKWTKKKDFPAEARIGALGLVIDGKGYVLGGVTWEGNFFKDIWEYTPETDTWIQKKDMPFAARSDGATGVANGLGYVGLGGNNGSEFSDWYEYNPKTDAWIKKADFIGDRRINVASFTVNGKIYTGYGTAYSTGKLYKDFYEYTPTTDSWKKLASNTLETDSPRGFVLNNKIYLGSGSVQSISSNSWLVTDNFYEYNIDKNTWTAITKLPKARTVPFMFAINGQAYMGSGSGVLDGVTASELFTDFYSFKP